MKNNFIKRHNGPREKEVKQMLDTIGTSSLEQLIDETVPGSIRTEKELDLPEGLNELEYINHLKNLAAKNKVLKSYIGLGYYNTTMPGVIQRNVLENPGWYTSYTPYQAEISQGRLEALLNFQTMIVEMTGMPLANASLLDEGTAAAEAMIMFFNARPRKLKKKGANKFFVSEDMFPQTIDILKTRAESLEIELAIADHINFDPDDMFFGAILQYPDQKGRIHDYLAFAEKIKEKDIKLAVAADLMSLALLTPPGEWGADVVVGSSQRFGIPMGYGGPHAAYFAATEDFKRHIPGRIIGISKDANDKPAFRMALQTREQHIKRERATSNICTAQALLANMAGMYAQYHGPHGIRAIAENIHTLAVLLSKEIEKQGYKQNNQHFFDTLEVVAPEHASLKSIEEKALESGINFRYIDNKNIGISLDETTTIDDINAIVKILVEANGREFESFGQPEEHLNAIPGKLQRKTDFLTQECFNRYHSETEMMRYLKKLENRDLALNRSMIPLGSCTMKLNAGVEMFALSWPEFANIHPFVPEDQAEGYKELINNLEKDLCEITGFSAISFQPNSGAAGEYTGLMVIREYLKSKGEGHRNICLIPSSAHGTNPASSIMAGMEVVVVKCDEDGNIDTTDLKEKAEKYAGRLAATMITYPSTHGVFEENILEIIELIHNNGGQVYMDGANMNAQVGLTNPGVIGADVCHLNLHKTFAIPHGGGGPGVGPIGVAKHLKPFLPRHKWIETGGEKGINSIASAPFGSAMILPISYGYIKLLGKEGLKSATEYAILNANYLKAALSKDYKILYTGKKGHVAHEFIIDCNEFHKTAGLTPVDIAKRLMDYGFHAPTVAFPVHGTLMVEPTESEPLNELNRFIQAMESIREEIREIEEGRADKKNNTIKNAPHTAEMCITDEWSFPYARQKAAYPVDFVIADKYFTPVTRIDDAYGDRNLVCTCLPVEEYEKTMD
ncbi:MAG: aminomethyl-transferring glycine dehydrogenase [Bacteroidales bacterium]|nr:aminomethyl-transferring glycine dehydrogenase [Bacteroidales bacterium]MCF8343943.1 aminomethyl-transferring glycine dehydrogenase [Bacteroidales bacterium]MCF8351374.1 aminomethyl-transferring glycine dehydrogenase [Bacteroidales bacterium]MCF8401936.1 aminomethyl-transferring glycine dehydrogenase [Bacteroidales bacterium]